MRITVFTFPLHSTVMKRVCRAIIVSLIAALQLMILLRFYSLFV